MQGDTTFDTATTTCIAKEMTTGDYALKLKLVDGTTIYAKSTLPVSFQMDSVQPSTGSLAGGTILTLTGSGFTAEESSIGGYGDSGSGGYGVARAAWASVITIPVPRSTNYLNAVLLCDVLDATATQVRRFCAWPGCAVSISPDLATNSFPAGWNMRPCAHSGARYALHVAR